LRWRTITKIGRIQIVLAGDANEGEQGIAAAALMARLGITTAEREAAFKNAGK